MNHLTDLIRQAEERYGDQPAVRRAGSPASSAVTYAELAAQVRRGAGLLRATQPTPGEPALLFVEPGPEWAPALFSILEADLVAVPIPAEVPLPMVAGVAAIAGIRRAIVSQRTRELAQQAPGVTCLLTEQLATGPDAAFRAHRGGDELALLAFTSGSTSRPRAVELTHGNLLANLVALGAVRQASSRDVFLSMLPPAHLFELVVGLLGPLWCGAQIVYAGALLPNRVVAALRDEGITHALAVPALLDALYEQVLDELADAGIIQGATREQRVVETARRLEQDITADELARLRAGTRNRIGATFQTLVVGGAALDPAWRVVAESFGLRLEVGYGLTEASPIVTLGQAAKCPLGSVGQPLPGVEVRVDENQEILVRGANVMRGYFRDAEATAAALDGGWLHTGDRGRLDDQGFLFVTGRLKEAMVTAAGETIYPEEIEPFYRSPLFAEHCVTALPGPQGNDLPTLFVVPAAADTADARLQGEFDRLRAAAPPRLRADRWIRLAAPLPRTASGKIRRRVLAQPWSSGEPTP